MRSPTLASKIARLVMTKKGYDIVTMDLRGLTSMADFFVVCSADSDIQARAIADAVDDGMRGAGHAPWHRETGSSQWILLDFVDVVLHVFHKNTRSFYNLEKLWGDAPTKRLEDTPLTPAATRSPVKKKAPVRGTRTSKKTQSRR